MSDQSSQLQLSLLKARTGDEEARTRLFTTCRSYLQLIARVSVIPAVQGKLDASDLVQQTLLDAHRDFKKFRGSTESEWLAWLRKILSHNVSDAVRHFAGTEKRRTDRERCLRDDSDQFSSGAEREIASQQSSPSSIAIHRERDLILADAIEQLEPDYREVIVLRNMLRMSFEQVARHMGRSRPATQMLWMRAIQQLRKSLSAAGMDAVILLAEDL